MDANSANQGVVHGLDSSLNVGKDAALSALMRIGKVIGAMVIASVDNRHSGVDSIV